VLRALPIILLALLSARAFAQPSPAGKHPRILLDDTLRTTWKQQAQAKDFAITRAIDRCEDTRNNAKEYQIDSYMGFDWNSSLQACLIAWVARGNDADAKSAVIYAQALLDDVRTVGDHKGGFDVIKRDTGYSVRSVPPYVAIAYDWLYDHPAMTASLKQRIRERLLEWLAWYRKSGYHAHVAGNNYNAGYVFSATLATIAIGNEGGEAGTSLWNHVRDDIWAKDMAKALGPGGIMDGGDWWEGWQYAPLSIAEYSLAAITAAQHGLKTDGIDKWLAATLMRSVHARSGALDTISPLGDVEDKTPPSMQQSPLTLLAIMFGPAPEAARSQAAAEYNRLKLKVKDDFLFVALAQAKKIKPSSVALEKWPTSYYAAGTRAFYARTTWAKEGVWMVTTCAATPHEDADHQAPMAGNLVVTRGVDEVIVDPSPYGSLSTLTTNAPTVDSKQHLEKYRPSQAQWSETTHFVWAAQSASGVVATRCDYADQYKFQHRASDIPLAQRDYVLIPWGKSRGDASIVVLDRGETASAEYQMYLRFRSPANFTLTGDLATAKVGATTLAIHKLSPAVKPEVRSLTPGDCWNGDRGKCESTRFPIGEYRVAIPGPAPQAVHVVDVGGGDRVTVTVIAPQVTQLRRGTQDAYVAAGVGYSVTPSAGAIHVVLADTANQRVSVTKDGAKCKVDVGDGATREPGPITVIVDANCVAVDDARTGPATPDLGGSAAATMVPVGGPAPPRSKTRGGCCDGGASGASLGLGILVLSALGLRRRRVA